MAMGRIHPSADDVVSFHDGTAAVAIRNAVAAHLGTGCAPCATAAARVQTTLALLRQDALATVPATAVEAALGRLRAAQRAASVRGVIGRVEAVAARLARLLLDTADTPVLAGARGAVAPVRQLVYEWEDDRYTLRIRRDTTPAAYEVMGQILTVNGQVRDVPVRLCPDSGDGRDTLSSVTGEFLFEAVRPGRYSLVVGASSGEVTLPGLELP